MDAQQFARQISTALQWAPVPIEPDSGETPTGYRVEVQPDGQVKVAWVRESKQVDCKNIHQSSFQVQCREGTWMFVDGVQATDVKYKIWFPASVRWARAGDEFDPQDLLQYYQYQ